MSKLTAMWSSMRVVGLVVVGAVGGALLAGMVGDRNAKREPHRDGSIHVVDRRPEDTSTQARLAELEARINGINRSPATGSSRPPATEPAISAARSDPPNPEELSAHHANSERQALSRYRDEGVDPVWAEKAKASLGASLRELAGAGNFSLKAVDCHTTMCVAQVQWTDYTQAHGGYRKLLHAGYEPNCARQIYVPEPPAEERDRPFSANLIFDCEESRASP